MSPFDVAQGDPERAEGSSCRRETRSAGGPCASSGAGELPATAAIRRGDCRSKRSSPSTSRLRRAQALLDRGGHFGHRHIIQAPRRLAALPLLACYLRSPGQPNKTINNGFLNLRDTTFDKWISTVQSLANQEGVFGQACPWYFRPFRAAAKAEALLFRGQRNWGRHSIFTHDPAQPYADRVAAMAPLLVKVLGEYSFLESCEFHAAWSASTEGTAAR